MTTPRLGGGLQLSLDWVAQLSPRRVIAHGWAVTAGDGLDLSVSAGGAGACPILHYSPHPRPDLDAGLPPGWNVAGFTLVTETPEAPEGLVLTLASGTASLQAAMPNPRPTAELAEALAAGPAAVAFDLLREAAQRPALAALLRLGGHPLGAFASWMARLPLLRGRAEAMGRVAEAGVLATSSGEAFITLRAEAMPPGATLEVAAIAWLQGAGDGRPDPVALPLADWHLARLPHALAAYLRLPAGTAERLLTLELVLHATLRTGEEVWLRCQPAAATVPELLDATCRGATQPAEGAAALDLLRTVIARREAAFLPALAALGALEPAGAGRRQPRGALVLGADDPMAARLFHVTAAEFERRCDAVLVTGAAAEEVAQIFARRGRMAVLGEAEMPRVLREAAGRGSLVALDAASFATDVAGGRVEEAFAHPLQPAEIARLLALHAVAGCALPVADSLARLLRQRRAAPGASPFTPVARPWSNRHAGELVDEHLGRLWAAGQTARRPLPEPAPHG